MYGSTSQFRSKLTDVEQRADVLWELLPPGKCDQKRGRWAANNFARDTRAIATQKQKMQRRPQATQRTTHTLTHTEAAKQKQRACS